MNTQQLKTMIRYIIMFKFSSTITKKRTKLFGVRPGVLSGRGEAIPDQRCNIKIILKKKPGRREAILG